MKNIIFILLLSVPVLVCGQKQDSLVVQKEVDSLLRLLRPLVEQQQLDKAWSVVDQVQEKVLTSFGPRHGAYSTCLAYRGKIAQKQEKYKEAEQWYLEAMVLQKQVFGKESPQLAISMSTLCTIYMAMGEYVKAEPLIMETLALREKLVGKSHPDYARVLGSLGSLHFHKGHYFKAELLYLEAMGIFEKTLGKKHPEYAVVAGNLSSVYTETSNYTKAEPLMLEVCASNAAALGKQHPWYIKSLVNLSTLYGRMGNLRKSEALDLEIIALFDNGLSKESTDYILIKNSLASSYLEQGEIEKAAPLLEEIEAISAKIYGRQHSNYASVLKRTGIWQAEKGELAQAEQTCLAALDINTKVLGPDHPNTAGSLSALAVLYRKMQQYKASEQYFLALETVNRRLIEKAAGYASESELFQYLQNFQANAVQFYAFAGEHPTPAMEAASFDNALFYKGFLLNASMQVKNRAESEPAAAEKLGYLHAYRRRLTEQYSLPIAERDSAAVANFEEKVNILEKELARTVVGYSESLQQVNWKDVQAALQPGEAAVEFIHFQYFNEHGRSTDSIRYAALVLRPGTAEPHWVSLFEERELMALLQGASGGNYRKINALYAAGKDPQSSLYHLIWQKLEPELTGAHRVYCSLSGLLHRINTGAISVNATTTIADRYQLVILGSTRQLVIPNPVTAYNNRALLVGGVNYSQNIAAMEEPGSLSRGITEVESPFGEIDSLSRRDAWHFLPATVTEVLNLRRLLQSARMQVQIDSGYAATEESIKKNGDPDQSAAPRVLHFATHGYFFPDAKNAGATQRDIAFKTAKNPLLRSGLILAGAQQVWTTGKPPAGRDDGVLTAQEISLLNLTGTELVVLSACETGLGDIDGNEGVYGLQRAFKIAGSKFIVMSLWKVNDQTTAEFMTAFYTQWLKKGLDIPTAFHNAQKSIKAKYPEPYHWAGFVLVE